MNLACLVIARLTYDHQLYSAAFSIVLIYVESSGTEKKSTLNPSNINKFPVLVTHIYRKLSQLLKNQRLKQQQDVLCSQQASIKVPSGSYSSS